MPATMTRFSHTLTSARVSTGISENRPEIRRLPAPPADVGERVTERHGGCRAIPPGRPDGDQAPAARPIHEAYARVIDELPGWDAQGAPTGVASAGRLAAEARAACRGTPTVGHCSLKARAGAVRRPGSGDVASTHGERHQPGLVNWLRNAVARCIVALGAILLAGSTPGSWRSHVDAAARRPDIPVQAGDLAPFDQDPRLRPIQEVQVGDRVAGINPLREQVEEVEPDPPSWRKLRFRMRKEDGLILWFDLLRPLKWVQANEIELGHTAFLNLPELGAVGDADVTYVGPCPPIRGGKGTVVTGKFTHQSDGSDVISLRLTGQSEPIGVTRNHPCWSVDRNEFVRVGELRIGELLQTQCGTRGVIAVDSVSHAGHLYNLETTEHVYRVGTAGALAHNSCVNRGGSYKMLRALAETDEIAHHMPQNAVGIVPKGRGPALGMTKADHARTRTFSGRGSITKAADAGLTPMQRLMKDAADVEQLFPGKYTQGIQETFSYARSLPPFNN
jgi:hypothetical protein